MFGFFNYLFIVMQFRTLGRLRRRLHEIDPSALERIWKRLSFADRVEVAFTASYLAPLSDRTAILDLFVAHHDDIPPEWMGDDVVAQLVFKANRHWTARIYRSLVFLSGGR